MSDTGMPVDRTGGTYNKPIRPDHGEPTPKRYPPNGNEQRTMGFRVNWTAEGVTYGAGIALAGIAVAYAFGGGRI